MDIPDDVMTIMQNVGPFDDDCGYYHFAALSKELGWPRDRVKAACREGRKLGLLDYATGLTCDDGSFYGSGYALTSLGVEMR